MTNRIPKGESKPVDMAQKQYSRSFQLCQKLHHYFSESFPHCFLGVARHLDILDLHVTEKQITFIVDWTSDIPIRIVDKIIRTTYLWSLICLFVLFDSNIFSYSSPLTLGLHFLFHCLESSGWTPTRSVELDLIFWSFVLINGRWDFDFLPLIELDVRYQPTCQNGWPFEICDFTLEQSLHRTLLAARDDFHRCSVDWNISLLDYH